MDFSQLYFGKPLASLTYDDIVGYFSEPRKENATMEYKSFDGRATFDAALQKVIRGLSSFLNSEGGILIWGAPKGIRLQPGAEEVFLGSLSPLKELKEKDSLINRISSAVNPLPTGIRVQILADTGSFVYVFEVQESQHKPHQFDYSYFIRLDGQSRPAPHYIVDAMMKRITYPKLAGVIKFNTVRWSSDKRCAEMPIEIGLFNLSELQNEEKVSFRLACAGGHFPRASSNQLAVMKNYNYNGRELIQDDFADVLHFGTPRFCRDLISFNAESLKETDDALILNLSFGGKKSPARTSKYKLDFGGEYMHKDPNTFLFDYEENVLFADSPSDTKDTQSGSLSAFTGRKKPTP